jgi:branched-chain amino acid transport system permease protein
VIYGAVLIAIVMFAPRGLLGLGVSVRRLWSRPAAPAPEAPQEVAGG